MPIVLAIVGPTAAGKSRIAEQVADRRGDVEIVAVDAFTVYRGMNIGTAKPSRGIRQAIPHHMIDVLDPEEEVSVQWFQRRARTAINDIHARGRVPLLVGGSGLYFRAVVDDLRFPPTDAKVRARLEREHVGDPARAHKLLKAADAPAAARIDPNNLRRTVRALEVMELTGERFSAFSEAWDDWQSIYNLRAVHVEPDDLDESIDARTTSMLEAGLLGEAAALQGRELSRTARQAIGYAEAFAVLDGHADAEDLHREITRRTRRYARRQVSWFKRDPRLRAYAPEHGIPWLAGVAV